MLLHSMFLEVASGVSRVNLLKLPIRTITTKGKVRKSQIQEDKASFGPLLETAKERKKKLKSVKKKSTATVPDVPEPENSANNVNEAELSWAINTTKLENLKVVRKNETHKEQKNNSRMGEKTMISKLLQLLEPNNPPYINKTTMSNLLNNGNSCGQVSKGETILPFSTTKSRTQFEDCTGKYLEDNKPHCDGSIGKDTSLKTVENGTLHFPIINAGKELKDRWEDRGIVSLKPNEHEYCLPGVTRILNQTMSKEAKLILEKWKEKMIRQLGATGFDEYCRKLLEDSKTMHMLIDKSLRKEERLEVPQHLKQCFQSIKFILKDLSDVRMLESHVVHPTLGYRGFIDCVANYRGNLCIIDWKKSEKIKTLSTTYDSPLQVSAYIGALNADPNYPFQVESGLVAIAYTFGQPPSVFEFSAARLQFYWKEWLKRLEKYKSLDNR
ncbi:mitochondrial genome maintenance exonuclease 1-like [Diachasmimorpha longicaudata]|uniref:mitochondrial genome maintenance exonuclease 1-like n=1 Tax=Diachasmimorpha longicaudata TaxID=58733 RepID=UPI0030B8ED5E